MVRRWLLHVGQRIREYFVCEDRDVEGIHHMEIQLLGTIGRANEDGRKGKRLMCDIGM